jgi:3-oxoacyl-[acyl-carrier-protein] synthase-3
MPRAAITAVGHYVPPDRLTNADLERLVDTNDEWIRTRTGIRERRILRDPSKATAFMSTEAAKNLLERNGLSASDLDLIIVATTTPDTACPATASLVQHNLGSSAWGFDVVAACSGFLFALATGAQFIESGKHRRVLVIGADTMSRIIDYTDRNTCILFGDGAGAVLLEPSPDETGLVDSVEHSDGSGGDLLTVPGGGSLIPPSHEMIDERLQFLRQDGRPVFKHAVVGMADAAVRIMERNGLTGEDVRFLVPHQANLRIIDATARRMEIGMDKVMLNIDRFGNTTAGTIPLCLAEWERDLRPGDNLVLAAFGGGFTWGASLVRWSYDGSTRPHGEDERTPLDQIAGLS